MEAFRFLPERRVGTFDSESGLLVQEFEPPCPGNRSARRIRVSVGGSLLAREFRYRASGLSGLHHRPFARALHGRVMKGCLREDFRPQRCLGAQPGALRGMAARFTLQFRICLSSGRGGAEAGPKVAPLPRRPCRMKPGSNSRHGVSRPELSFLKPRGLPCRKRGYGTQKSAFRRALKPLKAPPTPIQEAPDT